MRTAALLNRLTLCALLCVLLSLSLTACSTPAAQPAPAFNPVSQDPSFDPAFPPTIQELFVVSNEKKMSGFFLGAAGEGPHPSVILLHGYPGNEKNLDLAQTLRRAGFNVLFFHYRGAWGSEGNYSLTHLGDDVAAALKHLRDNAEALKVDTSHLSLLGHSMGGFAALLAGSRDTELSCVVGMAAANLGEYALRDASGRKGFSAYTDQLIMLNGFDGAQALREITDNAEEYDATQFGTGLQAKSVLLIAAKNDSVVPPAVQQRLVNAYAKHGTIRLSHRLIDGDHSFSESRIQLQNIIWPWLSKHCAGGPG